MSAASAVTADVPPSMASDAPSPPKFRRPPLTQYIAAIGDPKASSGVGAETWGLWSDDPGPRGVRLSAFQKKLVETNGQAPAGWTFDGSDWWLEEHGLSALAARLCARCLS